MRHHRLAVPLFFRVAMVLALSLAVGCAREPRPNILLFIIDTARADRFPWDGYDRPTAPRLAELAREGTVYTQAFSPAPWTVPAHASLFTGRYPSTHNTDCGSLRLPDSETTLAEVLKGAGYRTIGYTANPWLGRTYNFQQGFDTYGETWREVGEASEDTGASLTNAKVIRYLRWHEDNPEARREPFFMFVNYFEPHLPYHPPEPERSRLLRHGADRQRVDQLAHLGHPDEMRYILGLSDLTPSDLATLNDLYDGEIAYVDRRIGEILDTMRELAILDRTIVVVASDHGENIGDHHMMDHKMSVHATLLHVPIVLRYPKRVEAGRRIDAGVQLLDLFPTLLALAGVPVPDGVRIEALPLPGLGIPGRQRSAGDPIVGEFVGPPVEFLQVMQAAFPEADLQRFNRTLVSLRRDGYVIHWGSDGRHALYRVADDPGETRDLAASEPERLKAMVAAVEAWRGRPSL